MAILFCFPTSNEWEFLLPCILPLIFYWQWFGLGHSIRYTVVSHFCFNLQLPNVIWYWTYFHMLVYHLCIFFGKLSFYSVLLPIFNQAVCFLLLSLKSFCICWITGLYQIYVLQRFSPSLFLSSHSLYVVFFRAEAFNFNDFQCVNYFFHGSCLWCCN